MENNDWVLWEVNAMYANDLVMQGAMASVTMVVTYFL